MNMRVLEYKLPTNNNLLKVSPSISHGMSLRRQANRSYLTTCTLGDCGHIRSRRGQETSMLIGEWQCHPMSSGRFNNRLQTFSRSDLQSWHRRCSTPQSWSDQTVNRVQ